MIMMGDIGFSSNEQKGLGGFVPACIRFFTGSKWSHSFMITRDIYGEVAVQEAGSLVQIVPFDKHYKNSNTELYIMYRPKASDEAKAESAKKCFMEFAGVKYGNFQLIWFIYRDIMSKFGRDVRKQKNWMSDGVICSELVYWYLWYLGEPYQTLLAPWNSDTIQPQDILNIVESRPDLFELIEV